MKLFGKESLPKEKVVLIASIFIAGLCSIVYELLISTASSYFLGDSVKQFSITIGIYMAAMGIGAVISRKIGGNLLKKFVIVEIALGLVGGLSIPLLYFAFAYTEYYYTSMVTLIVIIGTLTGLEIPLITRIMDDYYELKSNISNVFSLDYFGALAATLIFPFILLPFLGTFKASLVFGLINMSIGFLNLMYFGESVKFEKSRIYYVWSICVTVLLAVFLFFSQTVLKSWEGGLYEDRIVYSKQSKYQKIVMTKSRNDIRMYLNGNLQFSTLDEYRYHEALIHLPFSKAPHKTNILMLGGGDGLAAREVLKYDEVEKLTLIDIDPEVIKIARTNPQLMKINENSMLNKKVDVRNEDAFNFLQNEASLYDVIIIDLPDPNNPSLARLYSSEFYKMATKRLAKSGVMVIQSTSAFFSKESYWCIERTLKNTGIKNTYPFHVYVPSFGDWGFMMVADFDIDVTDFKINKETRYLTPEMSNSLFHFSKDQYSTETDHSTLDNPKIMDYYLNSWKTWN